MSKRTAASFLVVSLAAAAWGGEPPAPQYEDGKFPPPKPPESKWVDLLAGKLEDHWSDMNCTLAGSFKLTTDEKGGAVLAGSGRPIGLARSMRPYENFILEVDWRHLTEAPSARGASAGSSSRTATPTSRDCPTGSGGRSKPIGPTTRSSSGARTT